MRATVFTPTGAPTSGNYQNATSTEVDVATVDELLIDLGDKAPVGTRVVAHHRGTTHFQLTDNGWKTLLRVIL